MFEHIFSAKQHHTDKTGQQQPKRQSIFLHEHASFQTIQKTVTNGKTVAERHCLPLQVHSALKRAHRPREQ